MLKVTKKTLVFFTYFTPFSNASVVEFEQRNASWVLGICFVVQMLILVACVFHQHN